LIARLWHVLSLRGDMGSEEGRAHERRRRVLLSALAAAGGKLISLLALMLTVPLTLGYLGVERFGLWMAMTGLLAVVGFADLGLGYGLVNSLARAEGLGDSLYARRAVSSAFFMLTATAAALALLLLLVWHALPWGVFFNARSAATGAEASSAMAVLLTCFLVGLPLSVVNHGFAGLQEGFRFSLYQGLGSLLSLIAIVVAVKLQAGLPWLVLASSGAPLLSGALGGWDLFYRRRSDLRPRLEHASFQGTLEIARLGGLFFVVQVAAAIGFQSDGLVLARMLGPESVSTYTVTQKLFLQVPFVLGYFLTPLWPAYAEAVARRDLTWVKKTLRRSMAAGFAVNLPAAVVLFFSARWILGRWVGSAIEPPTALLAALAVWVGLNSLNGPLAMFFNGAGALRYQALTCVPMAAANLALSILLTRRIGIAGVVLGSIIAQALFCYLPALIYVPRLFRRLERA
jgi:O-antigen/teichoic acid export membrane protein